MKTLLLFLCLSFFTLSPSLWAFNQEGQASWYGGKFHGRKTASGEIFDTNQLTAAHNTLPFGTMVTVTNMANGKQVTVRINDRGPFAKGRILDLSQAAARLLDMEHSGVAQIKLTTEKEVDKQEALYAGSVCQIQVGAYRNIKNAARLKQMLIDNGITPYAVMTNEGIVRIEIRNIDKQEAPKMIEKLRVLGIESPLIKA